MLFLEPLFQKSFVIQDYCFPWILFFYFLFYFIVTEIIRKTHEAVCNTTRESMREEDTFDYNNLRNENIFQGNRDR